jgi:putative MATE family efflux protein
VLKFAGFVLGEAFDRVYLFLKSNLGYALGIPMNVSSTSPQLTSGSIPKALFGLSAPMLLGILAMMSFNLIDTFFVSRLGTLPLAAMTLTFPVAMVVATFTIGLGVGAMAAISRGIGEGRQEQTRRYATDALTLSALGIIVLTIGGLASVEPLFRLLGADDATMPFVKQYMYLWYGGMVLYIVPMIGSNIMRATGDTLTPSLLMLGGMAINALLDPLFIFGWGPVPRLGIAGAAVASNVTRVFGLVATIWILHFRMRLLARVWPGQAAMLASWKIILGTGLPVAFSNALVPVAMGIVTRIITRFGPQSIAGFGIATRIEAVGFTVIIALSTGVSPFVGQNFGARAINRIRKALSLSNRFSLLWGAVLTAVFLLFGKSIVLCFGNEAGVVSAAMHYLLIVAISLGFRGVHQITWTALNVIGRPYDAMALEALLAFGLWIPLALAGMHVAGLGGAFVGLSLANFVGGSAALVWGRRVISLEENRKKSKQQFDQ